MSLWHVCSVCGTEDYLKMASERISELEDNRRDYDTLLANHAALEAAARAFVQITRHHKRTDTPTYQRMLQNLIAALEVVETE